MLSATGDLHDNLISACETYDAVPAASKVLIEHHFLVYEELTLGAIDPKREPMEQIVDQGCKNLAKVILFL